ncbi:adenylyltransferase/sulfurtransferase [Balneicella halophila]|uniref:Adenylyltransferase/sulfurtransferase n=1 Tax=Balneicella halophila TaxID=1537566 RepID=A0A7L4UMA6_BALHA|nr:HesA/MoeB/ThiF family protein [Balneicella halophila]PVX49364.1 adenylyltransferase/sulfurtransferase [Balneicella halophila]
MTVVEKERYSRQIVLSEIGEQWQLKLKNAKVLVIGAGGLGCPVLQYIVGAGVGIVGIVDNDVVSLSNLPRQILYGSDDIGKPKVEVATKKLKANNPNCKIIPYIGLLNEENADKLFFKYDMIVDCTDNFTARYLIDKTALKHKKIWIYGSILEYAGQVSVFAGAKGQSYRALFPEEDGVRPSASNYGVLGVLPGIIGCLQANEVLKWILGSENSLSGKLLTYNLRTNQQQIFEI